MMGEHDVIPKVRARLAIRDRFANAYIMGVETYSGYEVITIGNQGDENKSLAGWRLVTLEGFFVYKVPFGVIVKPGCQLQVACCSNASTNTKCDLIWRRHKGLSSNWDVILLVDASGSVVDRCRHGRFGTGR